MARIRTIKPEFFDHEELYDTEVETGLPIRLAYIGLWTECDREGRFEWKPRRLKVRVLPFDEVDFSRVLHALATRGFVRKYTVKGKQYGYIPSWNRHQIVNNKERPSELPSPDESDEPSDDDYSATPELTTTSNATPTRAPRVDHACLNSLGKEQGEREQEGNRKGTGREQEGKGTGKEQEHLCPPDGGAVAMAEADTPERIRRVFDHYRMHKPKSHPKPHAKMKEWGKIRDRLKEGHSVETLCEAIDGCFASPWHQGENDRQRKFNSLELIMRDSSKVSQFLELSEARGSPVMSERSQRNKRAAEQFNARFAEFFDEDEPDAIE